MQFRIAILGEDRDFRRIFRQAGFTVKSQIDKNCDVVWLHTSNRIVRKKIQELEKSGVKYIVRYTKRIDSNFLPLIPGREEIEVFASLIQFILRNQNYDLMQLKKEYLDSRFFSSNYFEQIKKLSWSIAREKNLEVDDLAYGTGWLVYEDLVQKWDPRRMDFQRFFRSKARFRFLDFLQKEKTPGIRRSVGNEYYKADICCGAKLELLEKEIS